MTHTLISRDNAQYREGKIAFLEGQIDDCCPYASQRGASESRLSWLTGFFDERTSTKFQRIFRTYGIVFPILFILCGVSHAGPKEAVAVAEAIVWVDQNFQPGITSDSFRAQAPEEASAPSPIDEIVPAKPPVETTILVPEIDTEAMLAENASLRYELAKLKADSIPRPPTLAALPSEDPVADSIPDPTSRSSEVLSEAPVPEVEPEYNPAALNKIVKALSETEPAPVAGHPPVMVDQPVELTTYTADGIPGRTWCWPCNIYHDNNGTGDGRMAITYVTSKRFRIWEDGRYVDASIPCTTWKDGNGKVTYHVGYLSLDELWRKINKPENIPPIRSRGMRRSQ